MSVATVDEKADLKKEVEVLTSNLRFTKIFQNTGADTVTIGNAQQTSTFEIPAVAFNLAKSYLNYKASFAAQGAGQYAHIFKDVVPWSRLELYTRGGVYLCDITNMDYAHRAMGIRYKSVKDFQDSKAGILDRFGSSVQNGFFTIEETESSGANATLDDVAWRINLSELYQTAFSLDKSIMLREVLLLKITWNPSTHWGYQSDNANAGAGTMTALGGNVSVSAMNLFLAQEMNGSLINSLNNRIMAGSLNALIPYVHVFKNTLNNQVSHSISTRLNRGHGERVQEIMTLTSFGNAGDESVENRYNSEVAPGGQPIISSYYSLLDSSRLSEFDKKLADNDDVWMNRHLTDGTVSGLRSALARARFAPRDAFGSELEAAKNQIISGLSLNVERKYDLYVTNANARTTNYYTVAVCQKMLSVTPQGVVVM